MHVVYADKLCPPPVTIMSLLKEAQKRWQLTESFSKSLYALLNATPKHKWNGLRVADEEGAITVRRFERTKVRT
jgi:hypothetical protein